MPTRNKLLIYANSVDKKTTLTLMLWCAQYPFAHDCLHNQKCVKDVYLMAQLRQVNESQIDI